MHRIQNPDGTFRQSAALRWARTFGYGCVGAAGLLLLISQVFQSGLANALSVFLLMGGAASALGAVSHRWAGEFLGLPLVVAGLIALGIMSWSESRSDAPWLAAGNLVLLTGFSVLLAGRWRVILAVYRLAHWVGRRDAA